jgi:phosphoribosyl-dephospho-CoA transferase
MSAIGSVQLDMDVPRPLILRSAYVTKHFNRDNGALRRHDLIYVSPMAWRMFLGNRDDLTGDPMMMQWVDRGWPFIARRAEPDQTDAVSLGLPLPPFAGKRRLALHMQREDIVSIAPPPRLSAARCAAPKLWMPTLDLLERVAARYSLEARVFGGLAWRLLTGLEYLTESSDLDILFSLPREEELGHLTAELALIDSTAPMRLDGELIRDDGAGVNWRELHSGARQVLVKTVRDVALVNANDFVRGAAP